MDPINADNIKNLIKEAIQKMVGFMDLECQVELKEETDDRSNKAVLVSIYTPENARFLIGKDGQNLKALEQVLRAMFLKKLEGVSTVTVDVNDYRRSRALQVVDTARQTVTRVRSTQKAEALLPMSPYERRIVHMELASYADIATESIGAEPNRRIVVKPYP
ncbi:MAG: R3H domain-containing nucleic acid-binding protein [Candidatus Taylorbacteria bacterium]|nr:R3H domain-containing nucleic acid-binding protein [Candidatus Taylorbacteria bacterium]